MPNDIDQALRDGYSSLVDQIPVEYHDDERHAFAIGYLYSRAGRPCPNTIRLIPDYILGPIYEVFEIEADKTVGYAISAGNTRTLPLRVYER